MKMKLPTRVLGAFALLGAFAAALPATAENYTGHGAALHGDLKYGPGFTHFEYANPEAPKGGEIRLGTIGTFDSLNPFVLKGISPPRIGQLLYESLLDRAEDEAFSQYGRLAGSIEIDADGRWVIFDLRPEARWHDGNPVTAEDVLYSLQLLQTKGHPRWRAYYENIESAEKIGPHRVKFGFGGDINRELPLIAGQFPVFPKHYWEGRDFEETTLEPPPGSGPYRIAAIEAGRFITYERVDDYWGRDLPVSKGRYNFDRVHFDFYRDQTVAIEALKAGEFDYRRENASKDWATAYDIDAVREGRLIKELIPHQRPTGMQAFWFNTRRAKFSDPKVREALGYAFDFEWTNANLFYGQYTRTKSFFSNSELASSGSPSGRELEILEEYRGRIPDEVFGQAWDPPGTDGSGQIRGNLRTATRFLKEAGWSVVDGSLTHAGTGDAMEIEFLLRSPSWERIVAPVIGNLERLGIAARIRTVDDAQYQNRIQEFDFDIVTRGQGQSLSPGNEQRNFWTSAAAARPGSGNLAGISDPVIDELVDRLIAAPDRAELVALTRALDRVLLWGHYVIPHWHINAFRTLRWDKFGRPEKTAPYTGDLFVLPLTWWYDAEKAARLLETE